MAAENRGSAFPWLFGFVAPHRGRLAVVLAASLITSALSLVPPSLTRLIIDDGLIGRRLDLVGAYCLALLGISALTGLLAGFNRWHYITLSGRVLMALREAVFAHLQSLSPRYFASRRQGDILARIDGDVAEIQRFAVDVLLAAVNAAIALVGIVALMALLAPDLLPVAFVALPAQMLVQRLARPRMERLTRSLREQSGRLSAFLIEGLAVMKLVQSVGGEARERSRLTELNGDYLDHLRRLELSGAAAAGLPGLLGGGAAAAVFLLGGARVMEGSLSVGTLVAFITYMSRAAGPLATLLGLYLAQRRARISLDRVIEIMGVRPEVVDPPTPIPLPPNAAGEIRFEGVSFAFSSDGPAVLRDFDSIFPAGAKVGLVGTSGSGKSTLADLLHRHYDPDRGRILLDGIDLRSLSLADLRRRIAVVAQDTQLVAASIADNIRFAVPDADDAAVWRAVELAQLSDFASTLPAGLDTMVGERGLNLSGGQRQRLAIARALLQDPLVLILDEATSAVDRETEHAIAATIDRLFAGRTRLVITHHPAALADADAVVELIPPVRWLEPAA